MDERHAQFLIVVADACLGAELAELVVEVLTIDGVRYRGVPTAVDVDQLEIAGGCTVHVEGTVVALAEVVEFAIRPPGGAPGRHRPVTSRETQSTVSLSGSTPSPSTRDAADPEAHRADQPPVDEADALDR